MQKITFVTLLICAGLAVAGCGQNSSPDTDIDTLAPPVLAQCSVNGDGNGPESAADQLSRALATTRTPAEQPLASPFWTARNAVRANDAQLNAGDCQNNTAFYFGAGKADVTGAAHNQGMLGYADTAQLSSGIHDRQFARAVIVESQCNTRTDRVVLVSIDQGLMFHSIRQAVVAALAADADLQVYGYDNVMLSATHSHATAAGQAHHDLANITAQGHDEQSFDLMIAGTVEAIRTAHVNISNAVNNNATGTLNLGFLEVLNANVQRSLPAFEKNPQAERQQFVDTAGVEVTTNRTMSQIKFKRDSGQDIALFNWYPIHGTSLWQRNTLLSGDNKGYVAQFMERGVAARQAADSFVENDETFVAAYAQADEGDNSPNIFITDLTESELRNLESDGFMNRGGGMGEFDSTAISGLKQLAGSVDLFDNANTVLTGQVYAGHIWVDFSSVTIDSPRVLDDANLETIDAFGNPERKTCLPALGTSFGAGAEDGRGPTTEGQSCEDPSSVDQDFANDSFNDLFQSGMAGAIPGGAADAAGCNNVAYTLAGYDCHAEKPILFPLANSPFDPTQGLQPSVLPVQIFILGDLAVVGLPWEVTTVSARRLRAALLDTLEDAGVNYAVMAGLTNGYVHYLTTREEYSAQQYEGASTIFGPWTQDAVQQEMVRLAANMRTLTAPTSPYGSAELVSHRTQFVHQVAPQDGIGGTPGDVVTPPQAAYELLDGLVVEATFVGGDPRNDNFNAESFLFIEREVSPGVFAVVHTDDDWETEYHFTAGDQFNPSMVRIVWRPNGETADGNYRIRHEGATAAGRYAGVTDVFALNCE